jgi:hypothetical protein
MAVLLGGFGAALMFFPAPAAEADPLSIKNAGVDVAQHQNVTDLPVHKLHNMALVFPKRERSSAISFAPTSVRVGFQTVRDRPTGEVTSQSPRAK